MRLVAAVPPEITAVACGESSAIALPALMAVACGRGTSSTSTVRATAAEGIRLRLRKAEREESRLRVGRTRVVPGRCTTSHISLNVVCSTNNATQL